MLEIFDRNPSSRVFHVDKECYVLYLGSHWDDYKPFLRLGTSEHLPPGLPPIVSTIVVPDVITGSPLEELTSLAGDGSPDTHYVGDVRTVNKLKAFLKRETIPVEPLKKASKETDDNQHVYVYSYGDGNLKIKFHKNEIFDLHRRERQDGHFVARAQSAKNEFGRGPFKFPAEVYQRPGFVVVNGTGYLVSNAELAALDLPPEYFFELAAAGVDPDRVSTVRVGAVDDALLRYFKRCRAKGRSPRVSTSADSEVRALAGIFRANSLPALKVNVLASSGGSFPFHRFTVTEAPGRIEALLAGHSGPIAFGSGASGTAAVSVDAAKGVLTIAGLRRPLLNGCVYQLPGDAPSRTLIAERYLPEKNYPYRDMLSSDENNLIDQLAYFFAELFAGRDSGKVLRTIKGNPLARDLGRSALNPITEVILANTLEYVRFLRASESSVGNQVDGLAGILERRNLKPGDIPSSLPLVGEILYKDETPYLFYRFAARITSDRVAHAERVVEKIVAAPLFDYESERNRLEELVAGLANPDQMEEARLRKIAERKKPQPTAQPAQTARSEVRDEPAEDRPPKRTTALKSTRSRTRRGGSLRWILPVGALVLLLVALLALLMTGTIPNRWFGEKVQVASGQTQSTEGTPGTDEARGSDLQQAGESQEGAASQTDTGSTGEGQERTEGTGEAGEAGAAAGAEAATAGGRSDVDTGTGQDVDQGTAGNETRGATSGQAAGSEAAASETGADTGLPQGWPAETVPAIRALEEMPGVVITDDRVVGPGGIEITVMDIINLVNRIATDNGYSPMHTIDPERPNPDWIYPDNVFVLPNGTRYTVVEGDTLWDITVRYMVTRLAQDYWSYTSLVSEFEGGGTTQARRADIVRELRTLRDESHSENFVKMVDETLANRGE